MKLIDTPQGSDLWHQHRAAHFGASEAPAMLGLSQYTTRSELLRQKHTGIAPEVDAATQRRFNEGHRAEELARPLAEAIIGDDLYPVVGCEGKLSASFDGLTMDRTTAWEHKLLNDTLRATKEAKDLPICYRIQMEQCLMLSGAERCLFSATKWDEETLAEENHLWYTPDFDLRDKVIHGWTQFAADLENYTPPPVEVKPQAEAIKALPAVFVQATGMVTASNLAEFKEAAITFIAAIKTELVTDEEFAQAEATVKFCKEAEGNLEATKASVLAQMSTVDEVVRTIDHISAQLRDKRLMLDKLVKSEKEARKTAIVIKASTDFAAHITALEEETKPIRLGVIGRNFAEAIKGLKSLASMQEKVDAALREEKFSADQAAKDIRAKLAWCKDNAAGQSALFPDLQALTAKPMEDFTLTITSRIEKQKADEAARLEAQRAEMQAEEERKATAKAQAEAEAIIAAERAKQAAEEAKEREAVAIEDRRKAVQLAEAEKQFRPTRGQIVDAVAGIFDVDSSEAEIWLCDEFCNVKETA